jgi:hypothetical protein
VSWVLLLPRRAPVGLPASFPDPVTLLQICGASGEERDEVRAEEVATSQEQARAHRMSKGKRLPPPALAIRRCLDRESGCAGVPASPLSERVRATQGGDWCLGWAKVGGRETDRGLDAKTARFVQNRSVRQFL